MNQRSSVREWPKVNGKVRICVDLTHLNQNMCWERHVLPSVEQTLAQIGGAKIFQNLTLTQGFGRWNLPRNPHSSLT